MKNTEMTNLEIYWKIINVVEDGQKWFFNVCFYIQLMSWCHINSWSTWPCWSILPQFSVYMGLVSVSENCFNFLMFQIVWFITIDANDNYKYWLFKLPNGKSIWISCNIYNFPLRTHASILWQTKHLKFSQ